MLSINSLRVIFAALGIIALVESASGQTYPPSPIIASVTMADTDSVSIGNGDNFPMTWADDDKFYTMYCDGTGFGTVNLSNGLAELTGTPSKITGQNVSSPGIEFTGGGSAGRKASGIVCIKGTLYALVRNLKSDGTGMSLFWSADKGKTWTEATWNWPEIGLADWLNMGRNYAGNYDGYAYFVAHDGNSAYTIYDSLMMARVPVDSITVKSSYQYFAGFTNAIPQWTKNLPQHKAVVVAPGKCYRMNLVYDEGIQRYLLVTMPWSATATYARYLGIFDAPNPWGPWSIAAEITNFTERRYHPRLPSKWISVDGRTLWFEYSVLSPASRYRFNLRKMTLTLRNSGTVEHAAGDPIRKARIESVQTGKGLRGLGILYRSPSDAPAVLSLFSLRGDLLGSLNVALKAGLNSVSWNGNLFLHHGIYLLAVKSPGALEIRTITAATR